MVVAPSFTLAASPASRSVFRGSGTTYTLTVTPAGGFNSPVGFSITGVPSGATATFSPTSLPGTGSSTLTLRTTSSTPRTTYNLTVTATGGGLTRTAAVSLRVF